MHNYILIFHQLFIGFPRFMVDWLCQRNDVSTKAQCSTTSIHDNKTGMLITLRGSLINQVLSLLSNNHEFESSQGYRRLTWSLTSGPVGLVEVRTN
jgi:hypothetical protein